MKVVLFGATGMIGSDIAAELDRRGYEVTRVDRSTGADVTSPESVAAVAAGADAIISAVSARGADYTLADVARSLVDGARRAGVRRIVVVGGAGSLEVAPGVRLVDTPAVPAEWRAEALEHADALEVYRGSDEGLDWTFASPAASTHPGQRTERYRLGGDQLLVDEDGNNEISTEDYAIAIADLLKNGSHARERVSVAW